MTRRSLLTLALALAAALVATSPAAAQEIDLDRPVRAGELILFPEIRDDSAYYYVVDKPRLALDANGRPQFSLLRYVENVRSGADEAEVREGEGGGILHALVSLSVDEDQLREAERELRRLAPGAAIRGPVVFRSGTFGLVSSFTDTNGNLSTQVVGIGNAPLLDGEKAAVSIQLSKLGAKVLWESFHTPTPDISFTFEMDVEGYRAPKRAVIEADFDRIYEHQAFGAGIATPYLAGEIKAAFDDLYEERAIRLEQVGDDEDLDALVTTAYNKITEMMFQPLGGSGTPSVQSLTAAAGGQPSLLDRASTLLAASRAEARQQNDAIRARNERARTEGAARPAAPDPAVATARATAAAERATALEQQAERSEQRARQLRAAAADLEGNDEAAAVFQQAAAGAEGQATTLRALAEQARADATEAEEEAATAAAAPAAPAHEDEVSTPGFAVVASYEMKRVRQRGSFRVDLNKWTTDQMTLRFDENIGDLRRFLGDESHFRQVNLDDPLYRQREIVAFVDGMNADDFGEYVNFVTVQLRKRHAPNVETTDEVRIDRNNFSTAGNNFKLLYGWKHARDDDRSRWLEYEYQTSWSFFGGTPVEGAWQSGNGPAINLAPPYQRREVTLEADPAVLGDAEVRSITVMLYYELGGEEKSKRVTLDVGREQLSEKVELMLPAEEFHYDYEISWRLRGNRTLTSGRQTSNEAILFVDELPEA